MYPSDYAYATDLSVCTNDGFYYNNDTTNCTKKDWLLPASTTWTITPYALNYFAEFNVAWADAVNADGFYGGRIGVYGVWYADGILPVLYLNPNIQIVNGTGTQSDPYIIQ